MALNRIEREILTLARYRIATGRDFRICYAIASASSFLKKGPEWHVKNVGKADNRLRNFIIKAIETRFGLEDWVRAHHPECTLVRDHESMRPVRLAWLDWLLDEPWTDHKGGPMPLMCNERAQVRLRNGHVPDPRPADTFRWEHWEGKSQDFLKKGGPYDIVAYKVLYEAPQ
jgi:hypothetical protein